MLKIASPHHTPMKKCLLLFLFCFSHYAIAETTSDALWRIQQGVEQQRRQSQDNTATTITAAPEQQDADAFEAALLQAINQQSSNLPSLVAQYQQQANHNQDMLLFAQAALAVQQGKLNLAISYYQQLMARNPEFIRGKLDLARLLFADYQNQAAARLFDEASGQVQHPVVQEKIQQYQQALNARQAWHGAFSVGVETLSNVNQSSDTTIHQTQTVCSGSSTGDQQCFDIDIPASTPPAERATGLIYEAAADKRFSLAGHHGLRLSAYASGKIYHQHTEFNEHYLGATAGYTYQDYSKSLSLRPFYRLTFSGQKLQKSGSGVQLEVNKEWPSETYVSAQLEHQYEHYRDEVYQRFNGPQTAFFLFASQSLPHDFTLYAGYDYLRKQSQQAVDSYHRHGARLGIAKSFPLLTLSAEASLRYMKYHDANIWFGGVRRDHERGYLARIQFKPFTPLKLRPSVEYRYTDNHSTSWVNRYRNHALQAKLSYQF